MREVKLHVETLDRFIGETMAMAERLDRGKPLSQQFTKHLNFSFVEWPVAVIPKRL